MSLKERVERLEDSRGADLLVLRLHGGVPGAAATIYRGAEATDYCQAEGESETAFTARVRREALRLGGDRIIFRDSVLA